MELAADARAMKRELGLLNFICFAAAILFVGLAALNAVTSPDFLSTDNLFVTMVCLVLALMFAINPILYLKSEGRLPIPFTKRAPKSGAQAMGSSSPALLDAKGRPVPADVRQIVARMGQTQPKDV